jgi:hypothetical protein
MYVVGVLRFARGGKKVDDLIVDWERADFLPKRKGELRLIIHSLPREIHSI